MISPSRGKQILLDGGSAVSPEIGGLLFTYTSVEAIGDFKLVSTNYSAEYGRTGGRFEVFSTRSGTNQFHGAVFNYFRNDALDARGFFARSTPVNRQNEFGAVLGGPLVRNRTFFHVVYSGFRYRAGAINELVSVPPLDFLRGDFSRLVDRNGTQIPIYDPATTQFVNGQYVRQQFPGNVIPESRFSDVARRIIGEQPQPTNDGILNNFLSVGAQRFERDQVNIKIHHAFNDSSRLSGFLCWGEQTSIEPEQLPVPFSRALNEQWPSRWVRVNHDYIASPSTLNHITLAFTLEVQDWRKLSADADWTIRLGLRGVETGAGNAFPMMTFTDGYTTTSRASGFR